MSYGKVFGQEMIMLKGERLNCAVAMTYCDCYTLSHDCLYHALECGGTSFSKIQAQIRKEAIRLSMRHAIREIAQAVRVSSGYDKSHKLLTPEQVALNRRKMIAKGQSKSKKSARHGSNKPDESQYHTELKIESAEKRLSFWKPEVSGDDNLENMQKARAVAKAPATHHSTTDVENTGAPPVGSEGALESILRTLNVLVQKVGRLLESSHDDQQKKNHDLTYHIARVSSTSSTQPKKHQGLFQHHHYM
jgi:hypothetical protein